MGSGGIGRLSRPAEGQRVSSEGEGRGQRGKRCRGEWGEEGRRAEGRKEGGQASAKRAYVRAGKVGREGRGLAALKMACALCSAQPGAALGTRAALWRGRGEVAVGLLRHG